MAGRVEGVAREASRAQGCLDRSSDRVLATYHGTAEPPHRGGPVRIREIGMVAVLAAAAMAACDSRTIDDSGSFDAEVGREEVVADAARVGGISQEALDEASAELAKRIASKSIAGGAHMVVRNGEVIHFEVAGVGDIDERTPLEADSIMRIYSMTKPIVSVAAMTLWEQGEFKLDDPVAKYIPAFENARVLVERGGSYERVPPERPISVRDVFRHTTGYSYGRDVPVFFEFYEREGMLYDAVHGLFPPKMAISEAADSLARIPIAHQPGAAFTYGFSTDLLGRLVEVWSGMSLDEYLREAIFEPLEMVDTGFSVPEAKRDRFTSCHKWEDGEHIVADKAETSPFLDGFEFLSGGGGLVSTLQDYANFCQMLVGGGEFNGTRVLDDATLELMFTDQLSGVAGEFRFGLGFEVNRAELGAGDTQRSASVYRWGGYANTAFEVVPEEDMFQIFMRQSIPSTHEVARALFSIVYAGTD
jgi:CubicO group peptidase (beta-lactamase class C family)